jgi:hypothetical protein
MVASEGWWREEGHKVVHQRCKNPPTHKQTPMYPATSINTALSTTNTGQSHEKSQGNV